MNTRKKDLKDTHQRLEALDATDRQGPSITASYRRRLFPMPPAESTIHRVPKETCGCLPATRPMTAQWIGVGFGFLVNRFSPTEDSPL
jgi:hypothetical protein